MLDAYRAVTSLAHPAAPAILSWRVRRGKEDPARLRERYGEASLPRPPGPLVWVHAASVGETVSVLPMVDRILARGDMSVLLTTGTLTSARIAEVRLQGRALHQYVPLDGPLFVRRFLDHWKPGLAIFVESELWPNLITRSAEAGAGLALVNARMSDRSFRRWRRRPAAIGALLSGFDLCLAQSEGDAGRLRGLGASPVACPGNLKYDVPAPTVEEDELRRFADVLAQRPRWAAASLHSGEDEAVLDAHLALTARRPGLLTIAVPRHPERGAEIAEHAAARGLRLAARSRGEMPGAGTDIALFDTIGDMGLVYRLSPVVFMGGSLVRHGGQNPIEPAKLHTAILHGPHVANFADVYAALRAGGGAIEVAGARDLADRVDALLGSPREIDRLAVAANTAMAALAGALDRTMAALEPLLAAAAREGRR